MPAEPGNMQALIALQQFVQAALAEARAGAEIFQAGPAEIRQVLRHGRRFSGKVNGGKKNGQLRAGVANEIRLLFQRLRVFNLADERAELAPVEPLPE